MGRELDKLIKKLETEDKLKGMSENERAFAILICHGFLCADRQKKEGKNLTVNVDYFDYHIMHCLANRKYYSYLRASSIRNADDPSVKVYFGQALSLLEERKVIEKCSDGDYQLLTSIN